MVRVQKAIFPCVFLAALAVVWLTSGLAKAGPVQASALAAPAAVSDLEPASAPSPKDAAASSPSCSLPARYPDSIQHWCGLIEKYAGQYSLDPRLVAAVMLQESGGTPDAYSTSGAVGLMQVMPRDGLAASFQCNSRPCFASRPSMAELLDPEFNISYGTRMLAGLIEKYGSVRDGLKAYGPMDLLYSYADTVLSILNNYN